MCACRSDQVTKPPPTCRICGHGLHGFNSKIQGICGMCSRIGSTIIPVPKPRPSLSDDEWFQFLNTIGRSPD